MNEEIFVIDDDPNLLNYMEDLLTEHNYNVSAFNSPVEAMKTIDENEPSLVITDIKMDELTGDDILNKVKKDHSSTGVILITGFGNIPHSVRAIRKGAFDYITKPFSGTGFISRVRQYFNSTVSSMPSFQAKAAKEAEKIKKDENLNKSKGKVLIGEHGSIQELISLLPRIAPTNAPVLIQGESGTGKEVYSNLIQQRSERPEKPFVKINCANLPAELVESTLFGHVKGAFTGATGDRKGAFEEADGGTLLLDEVTEIDSSLQAKLLRVLQEKEFKRVGSQKVHKVDVRIISTTNRNIARAIAENKFRKDLYYRLNVFPVQIPPLRKRKNDIPALAEYFCEKYANEYNVTPKNISDNLKEDLKRKSWPGNVRELENYIQRGVIISGSAEDLMREHVDNPIFRSANAELSSKTLENMPVLPIEEMELQMIKKALEYTNGNQKEAAELLKISDRTIRNKLKKIDHSS